ncbi:hypothetical protein AAAK29_30195 [Mesorhizobium sp. CCNWLW179-1]|nr:hypothetical protein [Mesorhizobium zhangyense]
MSGSFTRTGGADLDAHFEQPYTKAALGMFPELLAVEMELSFCTMVSSR